MTADDALAIDSPEQSPTGVPADEEASPGRRAADATPGAGLHRLPIEALADVELKVEVILGRARLRLQELLEVRPGQAIELDRARNSPVDVLINSTLFARGEIVVIDDTNLGVRITEIVGSDPGKEGHV